MISFGNEHRAYIEARTGATLAPDAQFIAHLSPYGVVAFERWTGFDIEAHFAGERGFLTPLMLRTLANYVFGQLGCDRVTGRIPASRTDAIEVVKRIGFVPEGRIRKAHQGEDFIVLGLLKEEFAYGNR